MEIAFEFLGWSSREIYPATCVIRRITRPVSSLDILGRAVGTGPWVAAQPFTIPTRSPFLGTLHASSDEPRSGNAWRDRCHDDRVTLADICPIRSILCGTVADRPQPPPPSPQTCKRTPNLLQRVYKLPASPKDSQL